MEKESCMDRNNKYYDTIENLIRNHKKFTGYETILDDIMDDVYSHSEIIISSIDDENVIKAYLEKIVSTSLVTVPKKLNFNKNVHHAVIGKDVEKKYADLTQEIPIQSGQDANFIDFPQDNSEIRQDLKVNTEYVDKMINLAEPVEQEYEKELIQEEDLKEDLDENFLELSEKDKQDDIETVDIETVDIESDSIKDTDSVFIEEPSTDEDEEIETYEPIFDANIQEENEDEVIEEITSDSELDNKNMGVEESLEETAEGEFLSEYEEVDLPEEDFDEETVNYEPESDSMLLSEENEPIELSSAEDSTIDEPVELNSFEESGDEEIEIIETEDNLYPNIETMDDTNEEGFLKLDENAEDLSLETNLQEAMTLEDDNQVIDDLTEFPEYNIDSVNEEQQDAVIDDGEEKNATQNRNDFIPSDFSCLYYEPKDILKDVDSDRIISQIYNLNDSSPELNVLSVYNLKYKQNMPVSEIAEKLSMDESSVIEALNKIIDLV